MARDPRRGALLAAALLVLGFGRPARGCSSFLLNASFAPGCVSGRTMDFEVELDHEVGYMPVGTTLTFLPVCRGAAPLTFQNKNAFAFLASARPVFQNLSSVLGVQPNDVVQAVSDGLNDKGLSITLQWDYDVPYFPNATACNTLSQISALDLSTFILGSFSTVAEVRAALDPARFSVVNFQFSPATLAFLTATGLLAAGGHPLVHLAVHDASHDTLVIEFVGPTHVLRENPSTVLTNEPQLPGHLAQLANYTRNRFLVPQLGFMQFEPGTYQNIHYNSTFYAPPGDHSSQSRYIRLAMLNAVAGLRGWPDNETWAPSGAGPDKGAWVAAENILNTIVLPPAIDDAGGAGTINYDYTQVIILRDQRNLIFYFRSPASPQWQAIDLRVAALALPNLKNHLAGRLFTTVPINHGADLRWYSDATAAVL